MAPFADANGNVSDGEYEDDGHRRREVCAERRGVMSKLEVGAILGRRRGEPSRTDY